jgi:hypothetical protein
LLTLCSVFDFESALSTLAIPWSLSASGLETVYSIDTAYRRASIDKAKPRHSALPLQPGVSGFGGFRSVGSAYLRDRIGRRGKLIEGKDRSAGAVRSPEEVMSYDSIITFQL